MRRLAEGKPGKPGKRWPLLLTAVLALSGCTPVTEGPEGPSSDTTSGAVSAPEDPLREARANNRFRYVDPDFPDHPVVLDDPHGRESTGLFFDRSQTAVIAGPSDAAQLRAASIAVVSRAPMLNYTRDTHHRVVAEVERLGATHVLLVGDVQLAATSGARRVIRDPGTLEALGHLTARRFTERTVATPADIVPELAALDSGESILLVPAWDSLPEQPVDDDEQLPAFPAQSRRDARAAPVVLATAASPVVSVANARSYGADVTVLDDPDPAASLEAMQQVAGLSDGPLVALGSQFGSGARLAERIRMGEANFSSAP